MGAEKTYSPNYKEMTNEKTFAKAVGRKLRAMRKELGMPMAKYSMQVFGYPYAQRLSQYELGQIYPPLKALKNCCDFHNMTLEEFFRDLKY